MPNWDPKRWKRNKDGSYSRRQTGGLGALSGAPKYASMTRNRLVAEAERRGIAKYGRKEELIARLEKNDAGDD